jgi:hypothetical protein
MRYLDDLQLYSWRGPLFAWHRRIAAADLRWRMVLSRGFQKNTSLLMINRAIGDWHGRMGHHSRFTPIARDLRVSFRLSQFGVSTKLEKLSGKGAKRV